jgi:hypothetical protein
MKLADIDFLVIGATKSATTWLQRSLQADPGVFMPDPEPHYFSRELARGEAWYLDHFAGAVPGQLIGEKSNSYLEDPHVASRIAQALPDAKLVAQLRSPVGRAYSDYCMMYRRGEVSRDVARYLDPRRPQQTRLLSSGLYAQQLQVYFDSFPRDQILVTFYEAIRTQPERQLSSVRSFLGLPPAPEVHLVQSKVKDRSTPMLSPWLRRILGPAKPLVAPIRHFRIFRAVHSSLAGEIHYSPLPDEVRRRLVDYYAADVEALGRLIGRDLSGWLDGAAGGYEPLGQRAAGRVEKGFVKTESTAGIT